MQIPTKWAYLAMRCRIARYDTCATLAAEINDILCDMYERRTTLKWDIDYACGNVQKMTVREIAVNDKYCVPCDESYSCNYCAFAEHGNKLFRLFLGRLSDEIYARLGKEDQHVSM